MEKTFKYNSQSYREKNVKCIICKVIAKEKARSDKRGCARKTAVKHEQKIKIPLQNTDKNKIKVKNEKKALKALEKASEKW